MAKTTEREIEKTRLLKKNDPDINLFIKLDATCSLMTNAIELELKHLRVTQAQVRVLAMLSRQNRPVTLEELADWCLKEFNSVSTLINRMEKNGLVQKIKTGEDLKTRVILTDKGNVLYHLQITERSIHLIFERLSDGEKKQLDATLEKIRLTVRDLLGMDFKPPFLT